jgi:hypothetical protein
MEVSWRGALGGYATVRRSLPVALRWEIHRFTLLNKSYKYISEIHQILWWQCPIFQFSISCIRPLKDNFAPFRFLSWPTSWRGVFRRPVAQSKPIILPRKLPITFHILITCFQIGVSSATPSCFLLSNENNNLLQFRVSPCTVRASKTKIQTR